jgi:hypothetical protein
VASQQAEQNRVIQAIPPTSVSKSLNAANQQTVPEGFAALMQGQAVVETAVITAEIAVVPEIPTGLAAGHPSRDAPVQLEGAPATSPQTVMPVQVLMDEVEPSPVASKQTGEPDVLMSGIQAPAAPNLSNIGQREMGVLPPQTAGKVDGNSHTTILSNGTATTATESKPINPAALPIQVQQQTTPFAGAGASEQSVAPTTITQPNPLGQMTETANRQVSVPVPVPSPKTPEDAAPRPEGRQAAFAPMSVQPDTAAQLSQILDPADPHGPQTITKEGMRLAIASPAQGAAKPVVQALLAQGQPPVLSSDRKTVVAQSVPFIPSSPTGSVMAENTQGAVTQIEPALQDGRVTDRPLMLGGTVTQTSVASSMAASVSGVFKPANLGTAPVELASTEQVSPASALLPTGSNAEVGQSAPTSETAAKAPAKPFSEALMAQVKSVEVAQGRTTVNLIPRGLGNIEIEVLSESDGAQKVVVRVENPAVLQALRDDRQSLAQAIGVSDSSSLDFQEHSAGDQTNPRQKNSGQTGAGFSEVATQQPEQQHLDVVQDGQLDILT